MPTWMAALILAAAIGATYFFCIRPMQRGECGMGASSCESEDDAERRREIAELREEIRILRAEDSISPSSGQSPDPGRTPPPS